MHARVPTADKLAFSARAVQNSVYVCLTKRFRIIRGRSDGATCLGMGGPARVSLQVTGPITLPLKP
jgi:hypothetical protein